MYCLKTVKFSLPFLLFCLTNSPAAKASAPDTTMVVVLVDSLDHATLGAQTGGTFVQDGGWQVTGPADMIVYDLGRYIENGSLEITVRNFDPRLQNTIERHHFLSMYRNPWGNHHPAENLETVWNLHSGFRYDPGLKVLSWTFIEDEGIQLVPDTWDTSQTYQLKVTWEGKTFSYYRNGVLEAVHQNSDTMQLRYIFLGRDFTVSGDLVTGYQHNQYPAMVGPVYSNLTVKELLPPGDVIPPQVLNNQVIETFTNAARISWQTSEPAVCSVSYWLPGGDTLSTSVLGPPAQSFSALLLPLQTGQLYSYQIVATDSAENQLRSQPSSFTTRSTGSVILQPLQDTFVEDSGVYDTFRNHGNFGWMSLLASTGRETYLRFRIPELSDSLRQAILRLHVRQGGLVNGTLVQFHGSWKERQVTWLSKPFVSGPAVADLDSAGTGDWLEFDVTPFVQAQDSVDFALFANTTDVISFDSRESENFQPELVVRSGPPAPKITSFAPQAGTTGSQVTVAGRYFVAPLQVFLGDTEMNAVTVISDSLLLATVPDLAQSGRLRVVTESGSAVSDSMFTVVQLPTVDSFSPTQGTVETTVLVRGRYFTAADSVSFNGQPALSFHVFSDTVLTATVPPQASTGKIQIHNPAGTGESDEPFVVIRRPHIQSFQPDSGLPGEAVLISGEHFTGLTTVLFNGVSATFTVESAVSVRAVVPDNAATGTLILANAAGADTSDDVFSVLQSGLHLIQPNGGEVLHQGEVFEIRWAGAGQIDTVNIDLSLNNGKTWLPIARDVVHSEVFPWTVPSFSSDSCRIKIFSQEFSDISDAVFRIGEVTGIGESAPEVSFRLLGNVPNPFNAQTRIFYTIPANVRVQITLFDILGTKIRSLVDEIQSPGRHAILWDGRDDRGNPVSSGMFFYRIIVPGNAVVGKMILLK